MIRRYRFGTPFETGAVVGAYEDVRPVPSADGVVTGLPYLEVKTEDPRANDMKTVCECDEPGVTIRFSMAPSDVIYGLGEQARGLNKRGWHYESMNTDNPHQDEGRVNLYGAHNFLMIDGRERYGLFIDTPETVRFDLGYTAYDKAEIRVPGSFDLYLIEEPTLLKIVTAFRRLTGRSYVPPKWAFGFGQSRWGYKSADDVRKIVKKYRDLDMPIDAVYMDIDYMDDYMNFTVDAEKFPNFKEFNEEMKSQGIRLVPIVDAGIKVKEGYEVYDEGLKKQCFAVKEDGTPFVVGVWPGKSVFPDVLNASSAEWFGNQYRRLTDEGIEGFWNDMNEPSIFYAEDRVKEAFEKVVSYRGKDLGVTTFFEVRDVLGRLSNDPEDYKRFYHRTEQGLIRHDKVHNLYGSKLTEAAAAALRSISPDKRLLLFSRSSYVGMHRSAGIWYGDNSSYFSHILLNLQLAMNTNMVGFLYSGADVAGFGHDTTPDLAMRWLQLGIFLPLFRNHSSLGTREQEFFRFGMEDAFRNLLKLRYALIPYLYSEFMKAVLCDGLFVKPLAFTYEGDERARRVEDQAMIGDGLMIAPVYVQNAAGRYVYVPEPMKCYRMRSASDYDEFIVEPGDRYIECALTEVLLFVRKGRAAFLCDPSCVRSTADLGNGVLKALKYDETPVDYAFYDDDGFTRNVTPQSIRSLRL